MGGISQITGIAALRSIAEFLVLLQEVIVGFHRGGERVLSILRSDLTQFILVSQIAPSAERNSGGFLNDLRNLGYEASTIVYNRLLPPSVTEYLEDRLNSVDADALDPISKRFIFERDRRRNMLEEDPQTIAIKKVFIHEQEHSLHSPRQW